MILIIFTIIIDITIIIFFFTTFVTYTSLVPPIKTNTPQSVYLSETNLIYVRDSTLPTLSSISKFAFLQKIKVSQ